MMFGVDAGVLHSLAVYLTKAALGSFETSPVDIVQFIGGAILFRCCLFSLGSGHECLSLMQSN